MASPPWLLSATEGNDDGAAGDENDNGAGIEDSFAVMRSDLSGRGRKTAEDKAAIVDDGDAEAGAGVVIVSEDDAAAPASVSEEANRRIRRLLDRRVLPLVCCLYVLSYLDRGNIGNAKTAGAKRDLGLDSSQWAWVLNAFYVCYVAFEWTTMFWKFFPAHVYVSVLCLCWGAAAMSSGAARNMAHLVVARGFLGVFEATFGAGAPYFLSMLYRRKELGFRMSLLVGMSPLANTFASSLAYGITQIRGSLAPWRLLFIIEGSLTVLFAPVAYFLLIDSPSTAPFLSKEDKVLAVQRLQVKDSTAKGGVKWKQVVAGFSDYKNYVHALIHFCANYSFSALSNFLPSIVKDLGYDSVKAQGLTAPAYFAAFLVCVAASYASDRFGRRGLIVAGTSALGVVGYGLLAAVQDDARAGTRYAGVWLAACGVFPALCINVTWVLNNQGGDSKKGAGLAIFLTIGQCSSFISSVVFPESDAPFYTKGCAIGCGLTGVILVCSLCMSFALSRENRRRDLMYGPVDPNVEVDVSEQSPLLSNEGEAQASNRAEHDSDGGGSGSGSDIDKRRRWSRLREAGIFVWALVATAAVIVIAVWAQHNQQTSRAPSRSDKRNLVFMVSDGMGPASLALTRSFRQHVDGLPENDTLVLDKHFWGSSRTRSSNSLVTDSAAGATAFSCGKKSYNGAISVLSDYEPCGSVLEAAKRAGYMTGLVVTTDITDATPACFASHVLLRQMQDDIALQEVGHGVLGRSVDLMLGGGRCHFLPNGTDGSCRADDVDVIKLAQDKYGWTYTDSRDGFDKLKGGDKAHLPLLGLFASSDIPFELDRKNMNDVYPSLSEMAKTALRALERATSGSDKGFFLMIEGSRIDHAGHINDPAAQVREVLEYDKAFKAVLDFIGDTDTETVLVATSDHETGGLATALQEPGHLPVYNWYPEALAKASASCERLAHKLQDHVSKQSTPLSQPDLKAWINNELVIPGLGVTDATDEELSLLAADPEGATNNFAAVISLRAHVGWSTHGHTAVDVNVYSSGGPEADRIRGNVENTDVGKFLSHYLGVDVDTITKELREKTARPRVAAAGADEAALQWKSSYHEYEGMQ
ncbi:repressible alkaline phosphatase precursor [Purpureocillium lilacinum]|uniref:Alkaline phosphatase n=1 Tax=Purpureocillium lilacinum TaxID=33203 RepID=A0A179GMD9_PURLI|nr:repressible alkaline phosphatase precursor [Purpureocillium lilacinum]